MSLPPDPPALDKVAWVHIVERAVLVARSHGQDAYYLPGGKREPGESDVDTLVREVAEELGVRIDPATAVSAGVFTAEAHGRDAGARLQMACYTAEFTGEPTASAEIAELAWLRSTDGARTSAMGRLVLADLHTRGLID